MDLAKELWHPPSPIRALTVTAIHLAQTEEAYEQTDLFDAPAAPKRKKREKLEAAMDSIRGKYGASSIIYGASGPDREPDPLPKSPF